MALYRFGLYYPQPHFLEISIEVLMGLLCIQIFCGQYDYPYDTDSSYQNICSCSSVPFCDALSWLVYRSFMILRKFVPKLLILFNVIVEGYLYLFSEFFIGLTIQNNLCCSVQFKPPYTALAELELIEFFLSLSPKYGN